MCKYSLIGEVPSWDELLRLSQVAENLDPARYVERLITTKLGTAEKRILIYGAGELAENLLRCTRIPGLIGLIDSDPVKEGSTVRGYPVFAPSRLVDLQPDLILIASVFFADEIKEQLEKLLARLNLTSQVVELFPDDNEAEAAALWIALYCSGVRAHQ